MAYHLPIDHPGNVPQHELMQSYMEPETVTRDSDEDTTESTSTPGDRQRGAGGNGSSVIKRAVSSPNVRGLGVDGMSMSAADKKRNKLGYHRTAVACGHCRRRKIRCIPAFEDASGRCQNCIRLKKDCHFFPVDQQSVPIGRRARAGSKADQNLIEGDVSASSSEPGAPSILKSTPEEHIGSMNGLVQSPLSPQETAGFPAYGEYLGPRPIPSSRTEFSQPPGYIDHEQNYTQRNQHFNIAMQPSSLHMRSDAPNARDLFYPHGPNSMMSSPLHSSPQSTVSAYPSRDQTSAAEQMWSLSAAGRSVESDASYQPYPPFRSQSYPVNMRRSSEPQHAYGYRDHQEPHNVHYSQEAAAREYQIGSSFGPGGYAQEMGASAAHLPASTGIAYPSTWYSNPGLPYVREEEDPGVLGLNYGRNHP